MKVHQSPQKLLSHPVVKLVGNQATFTVAGQHHVPKYLLFGFHYLLSQFAIRNVSKGTQDSACFPFCVTYGEDVCHNPADIAVFVTNTVLGCRSHGRACEELVLLP